MVGEGPAELGQPAAAADVEECVLAALAVGEVAAGVVDHVVGYGDEYEFGLSLILDGLDRAKDSGQQ